MTWSARSRYQPMSRARSAGHGGDGRTRAWSIRRSRQQHGGVGHVSRAWLLDDPVGPQQERRRDRQAERLGGLKINDELQFGGLLDGEIRGLGALEDLVHEGGSLSVRLTKAWRIRHEAASLHI